MQPPFYRLADALPETRALPRPRPELVPPDYLACPRKALPHPASRNAEVPRCLVQGLVLRPCAVRPMLPAVYRHCPSVLICHPQLELVATSVGRVVSNTVRDTRRADP